MIPRITTEFANLTDIRKSDLEDLIIFAFKEMVGDLENEWFGMTIKEVIDEADEMDLCTFYIYTFREYFFTERTKVMEMFAEIRLYNTEFWKLDGDFCEQCGEPMDEEIDDYFKQTSYNCTNTDCNGLMVFGGLD